ncbi:hypothetical protein CFC21_015578 [Triticum aestivum]|uniref:Uncharacterized protein n=2 Tax=Triticum aestivum TaxID=4565 RepID=A0A3B6ASC2_WHEAT|nr:momilactone A synthase-like [Triticum aestivum]KAF6999569.1 hypothetical protein CFC21_015578 [Triticum aestivum]
MEGVVLEVEDIAKAALYLAFDDSKRAARSTGHNEMEGVVLEVEDIAKAALYLASDDSKYVNGHNLVVDGGFTAGKAPNMPAPAQ